jgi:hypothetical protein
MQRPAEYCNGREVRYLFFAEQPIFGVVLRYGGRREVQPAARLYAGVLKGETPQAERRYCDCEALLDRAYTLPLGDRSWPDDTLVELEPMDALAPAGDALAGYTKPEVAAALGEGKRLRFDTGYEVWDYDLGKGEMLVLIAPSGIAARSRTLP